MTKNLLLALLITGAANATTLNVPRVKQETDMWCWLASSEMVLKYHGTCSINNEASYQVSMMRYMAWIGAFEPRCFFNPNSCVYGAGTVNNMIYPIDFYSKAASTSTCGPSLRSKVELVAASVEKLKYEIDHKRPFMAGINPSLIGPHYSGAEHIVAVIGYKGKGNNPILTVNDPFEYKASNPYITVGAKRVKEGVYAIPYKKLYFNFGWQSTVYVKKHKE